MPGGLLFDLDGTLLDTAPEFAYCLNALRTRAHLPPLSDKAVRAVVSSGAQGMIDLAFGLKPGDLGFDEKKEQFLDLYEQSLGLHTRYFEGIEALLDTLNAQKIPWGIVTNKPQRFSKPLLQKIKPLDEVACLISGDTFSESKPSPMPVHQALKTLNIDPKKSIFFGDDLRDIQAAHAADMRSCTVEYGYVPPKETWMRWGAHHTVEHAKDILPLYESYQT